MLTVAKFRHLKGLLEDVRVSFRFVTEVFKVAFPAMLNQLIMSLEMTLVIFLASVFFSEGDVAALGGAVYVFWLDFSVLYFGAVGISSITSRAFGEGDKVRVGRVTASGALLMFLTQALITGLYVAGLNDPLLHWMGFSGGLANEVDGLLKAFMTVFLVRSVIWAFSSALMGVGRTDKMTLSTLAYLIPEQIVMVAMFYLRYPLEVALFWGFAVGAVIGAFVTYALLRGEGIELFGKGFKDLKVTLMDWWEIIRIGVPSSISSILFSLVYVLMLPYISSFGKEVLASLAIAQRVETVIWMVAWGLYSAAVALVGRSIGSKRFELIDPYLRVMLWGGFLLNLLVSLVLVFKGMDLLGLVTPSEKVAQLAYSYLFYTAIMSYFMVLEGVYSAVLVAMARTVPLMLIDSLFNFSRLPLLTLLIPKLSVDGIWLSINLSNVLKGVSLAVVATYMLENLKRRASVAGGDKL